MVSPDAHLTDQIEIAIVHGIPEAMRPDAMTLYEEAFGPKFAVAISNKSKRLALLSDSLNLEFAFGAFYDGQLVGLAGYKTEAGSFTAGVTYSALKQHLGMMRGTWAAFLFSLYERSIKPGQLLMDGIVVAESMRGQGTGTRLLDRIAIFARDEGYDSVRLDVIDTNPDARRMYDRNDFVATKTEHFGYLRWLLGFGSSTTLVRDLND